MSRELATAFFQRDLTPAEADALEAALESSPEAAEALLAGAAAHYQATGLPEPRWAQRRPARVRKGWWLAALLLSGGALFALNRGRSSAKVFEVREAEGDLPVVELLKAEAIDEAEPDPAAVETPQAKAAPAPTRQGLRLGVVLRLKEDTRLGVKVYDSQGQARRQLFDGLAAAGERRYEWDGRDEKGRRLPAGTYEVRVQGPGIALVRPVKLKAQAD